jgi:hypothetical protein
MAATPAYAATPNAAMAQIATANTARDGTGTLGTLVTGAASGTRVDDIYITAAGTTTAGVVRMFMSDGTNHRLIQEVMIAAITPSATTPVWSMFLPNLGILLPSGWSLRFSTNNAEAFNIVMTRGGNL